MPYASAREKVTAAVNVSKTVHEVTEQTDKQLAEDLDVTYLSAIMSEDDSF